MKQWLKIKPQLVSLRYKSLKYSYYGRYVFAL